MLVTTSRYSSAKLRMTGRKLASVTSSLYVARGKKTIDALASFARRIGNDRVCIITGKGKSALLEFVEVNELGYWNWIDKTVQIKDETPD